jgi:hypothetical protein
MITNSGAVLGLGNMGHLAGKTPPWKERLFCPDGLPMSMYLIFKSKHRIRMDLLGISGS